MNAAIVQREGERRWAKLKPLRQLMHELEVLMQSFRNPREKSHPVKKLVHIFPKPCLQVDESRPVDKGVEQ